MTTNCISARTGQFAYFDRQLGHPVWAGKRVLHFGGNVGNIFLDPNGRIEHDKYWSIFTHVSKAETLELADQLLDHLTDVGKAAAGSARVPPATPRAVVWCRVPPRLAGRPASR